MSLGQKFSFSYHSTKEVEEFINKFATTYEVTKDNDIFKINSIYDTKFTLSLTIKSYGLETYRHGEYFEILGVFIEQLSGEFGAITIEDI